MHFYIYVYKSFPTTLDKDLRKIIKNKRWKSWKTNRDLGARDLKWKK